MITLLWPLLWNVGKTIDQVLTITATPVEGEAQRTSRIELAAIATPTWENVDTAPGSLHIGENCTFEGHEGGLRPVFENLDRNAIEYGSQSVSVEVGRLPGGLYVADDSPGIEASDRERVFESGYTTSRDGTGFGLAIVRKMVDTHGWTIQVIQADTRGAGFVITGVNITTI